MKHFRYRPLKGQIIVKTLLEGGLKGKIGRFFIPETAWTTNREDHGKVIAANDTKHLGYKIGDEVWWNWRDPMTRTFWLNGEKYVVLREVEVFAVTEKERKAKAA